MGKPKVTALAPWNEKKLDSEVRGDHVALGGTVDMGKDSTDQAEQVTRKAPAPKNEPLNVKKASDTGIDPATYGDHKDPNDRKQAWKSSDTLPDCSE